MKAEKSKPKTNEFSAYLPRKGLGRQRAVRILTNSKYIPTFSQWFPGGVWDAEDAEEDARAPQLGVVLRDAFPQTDAHLHVHPLLLHHHLPSLHLRTLRGTSLATITASLATVTTSLATITASLATTSAIPRGHSNKLLAASRVTRST